MSDTTATVTAPATFTVRLIGWDTWDDLHRAIKAITFGHMVKLATPIMGQFQSDLYHDAVWLHENVTGPTEFEWLIRPSGTDLGVNARVGVEIGPGATAQFWIVRIFDRNPGRGDWHATFTYVPLAEVASLPPRH